MNVVKIVQVKEVKKPDRKSWAMSSTGFERLSKRHPRKYAQVGVPDTSIKTVIVTKKKVEIKPSKAK